MARAERTPRCGALIRAGRRRHKLDQAELATRLGTSQAAISRLERDFVSPTLETLNRIFEAMGETLSVSTIPLGAPVPGGSNQPIAELRADFRELTPAERLDQAAELSEIATELASGAK
jgi:transcriptional regulator with XRE-family HTH domain